MYDYVKMATSQERIAAFLYKIFVPKLDLASTVYNICVIEGKSIVKCDTFICKLILSKKFVRLKNNSNNTTNVIQIVKENMRDQFISTGLVEIYVF